MEVIMICGSRNPEGQTARAMQAMAAGIARAGGHVEKVFLPIRKLEHCRQCDDNGWGLCRREGRCVIADDFADIVAKLRPAHAVIMATPVYYSDLSESLRVFLDRLRRICTHPAGRLSLEDKAVIGICVAGGGGGGAPACCVSLEKILSTCKFDVVDMIPVRRQNLAIKMEMIELAGAWLATGPRST